ERDGGPIHQRQLRRTGGGGTARPRRLQAAARQPDLPLRPDFLRVPRRRRAADQLPRPDRASGRQPDDAEGRSRDNGRRTGRPRPRHARQRLMRPDRLLRRPQPPGVRSPSPRPPLRRPVPGQRRAARAGCSV
ncbi:MAG: hypothetical protein AVDCRST_MAG31-2001, partial [uncultured Sphingomonas sp.]